MPNLEILSIFVLGALAWLWFDSLKAREVAIHAARTACTTDGLMLLDDSVEIAGLKLTRDDEGRLRLQRLYHFKYSDTGNNRLQGSVILLGHRVLLLNVGAGILPRVTTLH